MLSPPMKWPFFMYLSSVYKVTIFQTCLTNFCNYFHAFGFLLETIVLVEFFCRWNYCPILATCGVLFSTACIFRALHILQMGHLERDLLDFRPSYSELLRIKNNFQFLRRVKIPDHVYLSRAPLKIYFESYSQPLLVVVLQLWKLLALISLLS